MSIGFLFKVDTAMVFLAALDCRYRKDCREVHFHDTKIGVYLTRTDFPVCLILQSILMPIQSREAVHLSSVFFEGSLLRASHVVQMSMSINLDHSSVQSLFRQMCMSSFAVPRV